MRRARSHGGEVAAVRKLIDSEALKVIENFLLKGPRRGAKSEAISLTTARTTPTWIAPLKTVARDIAARLNKI